MTSTLWTRPKRPLSTRYVSATRADLNPKNKNMKNQITWKMTQGREDVERRLFVGSIIMMVIIVAIAHIFQF